ncbi:MAG TPA: D-glucuronyl C5-epimerase family protein [Gaiellaceae bacterium]|nr:D-glucuronyl C5-epimerase family protein [Gaiellaceae bacterium]
MRGLAVLVAALAALVVTGASAGTPALPAQKKALQAVNKAAKAGRIDPATASRARSEIGRAARLIRGLPNGRSNHVAVALSELAAFDGRLTKPRAVALVGQLKANDDWFALHWAPSDRTDITDADGVVYRYFAGRCFELHPLANFGALNARIAAGDTEGTVRLADALIARGVFQTGGGVGYEYYFDFSGGRAPWLSGMAQAVAAQAFARAALMIPEQSNAYLRAARDAYDIIPRHLLTSVAAGPWIRLYGFQSLTVLNAQLQAVVSLTDYAQSAEDASATALAARMKAAAAATLPRFDTGYWTYYSLPHEPSPLDYQQYVVQLLAKLAPTDPRFAAARTRIAAYAKQPTAFMVANGGLGTLRLWLSKPASVQVQSAAGPTRRLSTSGGWVTVGVNEPTHAGVYPVRVTATDWAGNRSSFDALPIVRVAATGSPAKTARKGADAETTPTPSLAVGAALDDPSQAAAAQKLGLRVVRMGVAWPVGSPTPDPSLVSALQRVPAGVGLVVELYASPLPIDEAGREALAEYAASLAQQVPGLRNLLLTPAPTPAGASAYAVSLAAVADAVHAVNSTVAVGPLVDGAVAPKAVVSALGRAFKAAGRQAPYVDLIALRPAPAPATTAQWTEANVPQLEAAATASLGGAAPVLIDGLAVPTTVPAAELPAYGGGPPPTTGAVSATTQGSSYAAAIAAAACSPSVAGVILDRIQDSATAPVAPTGLYYADGTAKTSAAAVGAAAAPAQRGTTVCPGLATAAGASALTFPPSLSPSAAASFKLACTRDCLYLATLDGPDGKPVAAKRGAFAGGAAPATVTLPKVKLGAGAHTLDVRLSSQVNPGTITQLTSGPLQTG